jgi:hypothetical protein
MFAARQCGVWTTGLFPQEMRTGAVGSMRSVYVRDPDLNPIEIPEQV